MQALTFIFDVEGTLVDCVPQVLTSWRLVLADWHLAASPEELSARSGMDPNDMLAELFPALNEEDRRAIVKRQGEKYRAGFLSSATAFPRARDLLFEVKRRGSLVGLATTCDATELAYYRKLVDANQAIDAVTCGEDVPRGKPHPDLFKLALKRLGVESGIAVGDTPYDAIAARRAGMRAIGLLTGGFSEAVLREAGCVDIVDDPAGLLSALDERLRL
jgi:HAD superfamily hydrolase (TIGR01509 family)